MLYDRGFRDMSARFYENAPWPTAKEIADIVKHDIVFLSLYKMLYFRSLLGLTHADRLVALTHHADSWVAHKEFLELLMDPRASADLQLPPAWLYDILCNEIPYRCETFHALLASSSSAAGAPDRDGPDGDDGRGGVAAPVAAPVGADAGPPGGADSAELSRAWGIPQLMGLLHDLVDGSRVLTTGTAASGLAPATNLQTAGYFALVALCRLYTKLGDYAAAVEAARPLGILAGEGLFSRIPACHLALSYYLGFALVMCRRFDDAFKTLSRTLSLFHRVHRVLEDGARGYMRVRSGRMLEFLALCVAVLPGAALHDENLRRVMRDRHATQIERISSGEGMSDIEDIFTASAPGGVGMGGRRGVVCLVLPPSVWPHTRSQAISPYGPPRASPARAPTQTLSSRRTSCCSRWRLRSESRAPRACAPTCASTRASTSPSSLTCARAPSTMQGAFSAAAAGPCCCCRDLSHPSPLSPIRAMLTSLKIKMWAAGPGLLPEASGSGGPSSSSAPPVSADPLHFFLVGETVTIEEAKASKDFNAFFIRNIEVLTRVARDAEKAIAAGGGAGGSHGHRGHGGGGGGGGGRQFHQHGSGVPGGAAAGGAWRR